MNTRAEPASENKSPAALHSWPKLNSTRRAASDFADNRPEASALSRLQELANQSERVGQLKALQQLANDRQQVSRLRALQQLANSSPQAKQAAQLRALAKPNSPAPIQQDLDHGIAQLTQGPEPEEEELIQAKFETVQRQPNESDAKPRVNNTGLPDQLKAGIETLSGLELDHVRVHYNSSQPAQLNALAYAQGSDIHLAPGQEQHLPHEAWHIVQQAQGRVRPTLQLKNGVPVNDDAELEREADVMGARAVEGDLDVNGARSSSISIHGSYRSAASRKIDTDVAQRTIIGMTPVTWAKQKNEPSLKTEKLLALAQRTHDDILVFELSELDGFYKEELANRSHSDIIVNEDLYLKFKQYVAFLRDAEGAHGHERHAGKGDAFIVDRVNKSKSPKFTASYLLMDEYLKWDSILKLGSEGIFKQYMRGALDVIYNFASLADNMSKKNLDAKTANTIARDTNPQFPGKVDVNFGNGVAMEKWVVFPSVYLPPNPFLDGEKGLEVKVGASAKGETRMNGRTVSKVNDASVKVGDVKDDLKKPEAHTGGLAPRFELNANLDVKKKPEASDLKWVTKF